MSLKITVLLVVLSTFVVLVAGWPRRPKEKKEVAINKMAHVKAERYNIKLFNNRMQRAYPCTELWMVFDVRFGRCVPNIFELTQHKVKRYGFGNAGMPWANNG